MIQPHAGRSNVEARFAQVRELVSFIERKHIPQNESVIIAGDFNQDFHAQVGLNCLPRQIANPFAAM